MGGLVGRCWRGQSAGQALLASSSPPPAPLFCEYHPPPRPYPSRNFPLLFQSWLLRLGRLMWAAPSGYGIKSCGAGPSPGRLPRGLSHTWGAERPGEASPLTTLLGSSQKSSSGSSLREPRPCRIRSVSGLLGEQRRRSQLRERLNPQDVQPPSLTLGLEGSWIRVPVVAQWLTNPTRNHDIAGLVPGLAQWVKASGVAMCCGVGCRLCLDTAWLWRRPAAAADSTPRLGTSLYCGCGPKKTRNKTNKQNPSI